MLPTWVGSCPSIHRRLSVLSVPIVPFALRILPPLQDLPCKDFDCIIFPAKPSTAESSLQGPRLTPIGLRSATSPSGESKAGLFVCNQLDCPTTCGPNGHDSSSAAALRQRAVIILHIFPNPIPVRVTHSNPRATVPSQQGSPFPFSLTRRLVCRTGTVGVRLGGSPICALCRCAGLHWRSPVFVEFCPFSRKSTGFLGNSAISPCCSGRSGARDVGRHSKATRPVRVGRVTFNTSVVSIFRNDTVALGLNR